MEILVTGATGYLGHAAVGELAAAGHAVTGLVRSEEKAAHVRASGAQAVIGDIRHPETFKELASQQDAIIHTAFDASGDPSAADRTALDALLAAARAGRTRSFVYTSGVWVLGATGDTPAFEHSTTDRAAAVVAWRPAHERLVVEAATHHLATAVVRPGVVYGGRGWLTSIYFASAEKEGAAAYVGDGRNRLALIHVEDLARYYRLLVEHHARGIFHAVDGTAVPVAEVARAASEAAGRGGATRAIPIEEARTKMGAFADALTLDQVVESRRSSELGWVPTHPNFLGEADRVYQEWKSSLAAGV